MASYSRTWGLVVVLSAVGAGCRAGPAVCSTGKSSMADEGFQMEPGGACITCHAEDEGPAFSIAGTVMAAADDDTRCVGVEAATVEITDANGQVLLLDTNSVGNFTFGGAVAMPYTARVLVGGAARAMSAAQSSGDCNACHTAEGAQGAPGRIRAP